MSETEKPQGRSMQEIRAIVAAERERWFALEREWELLTNLQQVELIETAKEMNRR